MTPYERKAWERMRLGLITLAIAALLVWLLG